MHGAPVLREMRRPHYRYPADCGVSARRAEFSGVYLGATLCGAGRGVGSHIDEQFV